MGVAGVEAEADLVLRLGQADRIPELRERVEAARDGVVAARRVLEVDRHLGLDLLERPRPAADALVDPVLRVARMDDDGERADLRRRLARLLEDLPRAVADVRLGRADVDQVRRVDVDPEVRGLELLGVVSRRRLLPALRVREEELHPLGADLLGLGERVLAPDVCADGRDRHTRRGYEAASAPGTHPASVTLEVACQEED